LSKLQLKELRYASPEKQIFNAFNPETEENMLLNIYQSPTANVNYESTIYYNETLVALAIKQKTPLNLFATTSLKCFEKTNPVFEHDSILYCLATYKFRDVCSLPDFLRTQTAIEWNEKRLLKLLLDLTYSLSEVSRVFNYQKLEWDLKPESIYFDFSEKRFITQIEPMIKSLGNKVEHNSFEAFVKEQSVDLLIIEDANLLRAVLIVLQMCISKDITKGYSRNYSSIMIEIQVKLPSLAKILSNYY